MTELENIFDVVIVGSGPAGLSAAIYAKRAGLNILVIEKQYMGAGQIAYSDKVDNYLGIPAVNGFDRRAFMVRADAGTGIGFEIRARAKRRVAVDGLVEI